MDLSSGRLKSIALNALKNKWGVAILVSFIALILGGISSNSGFKANFNLNINTPNIDMANNSDYSNWTYYFFSQYRGIIALIGAYAFILGILWAFVGSAVELGHNLFYLNLIRNGSNEVNILFSRFSYIIKAFGLRVVKWILIVLWSLLFLIPGIIAYFKYSMASYIMAENPEIGIMEALDMSKEMMNGYKFDLFILHLSFIGWYILCALTCGLGIFVLNPYIYAAEAAFYNELVRYNFGTANSSDLLV